MKCNSYLLNWLSLIIVMLTLNFAWAQKPSGNISLELIPDETEASITENNMRVNPFTGVPIALYKPNYQLITDTPEKMAKQYLAEKHELFRLSADLSELRYLMTKETPGGYHVHFIQYKGEYPVINSDINVTISRDNRVVFVMNGSKFQYGVKTDPDLVNTNISTDQALISAKNYLGIQSSVAFEKSETKVYYNQGKFRLAQVVRIVPAEELFGEWEVMIDAQTGEIFRVEDKACYLQPGSDNPPLINGTGYVFDPDPITHARTTYGTTGFVDNNDADSDSLTFHRELRTLYDISFEGGVYILKGPWAEIRDFESPFTGLHTNSTSDFLFTRFNDNFEAVNTYFHIDNTMRWINNTLGIPLVPYQYTGGVRFDPHGLNGDDNSHYIPGTGSIAFGDGGVDDAEDLGVVLHEFGHGLHDWITVGGISQVEGLSEGCGDYWATSYIRSSGYWTPAYPAYNWVFIWDGHNPFWAGRITNYTAHYPEGLTGQIHTDGQMWASSLMSIYDLIGRVPTDTDFIEALAMTNGSSNQPDAANAFITADQLIYGGNHLAQIIPVFVDRGYLEGPITADFMADITGGQAPLTVHFTDLSVSSPNPIISWEWDFNNDGIIDSYDQNPTWVYTNFGSYTVSLTVSDGTNTDNETKTDYISVNGGILVWEGEANGANYSGTFIRNYLQSLGFSVVYSTAADLPSTLAGYDAAFLSFGNYGSSGGTNTELTDNNAAIVISYLQSGGKVYLEGGDALGYDQSSNSTLLNLFGLASASDGSSANLPVTNLSGQTGALTDGMLFTSSSQPNNNWIDIYTPNSNGQLAFIEQTSGNVAVQGQGTTYNQKTFCFSYALGKLNNQALPSTKENLVDKILDFFDVVIPVELTSFTASTIIDKVELNWRTATETNNQGFQVERMSSTGEYVQIGFIEGHGTTAEAQSYSFVDSKLEAGSYTYRLKQIDFDGSYEYSDEVNVVVELPLEYALEQNYPNPFNPSTKISYSIPEDGFVKLAVYNLLGEEVATIVNSIQKAGKYEMNFDGSKLSSGVYVYKIEATNFSASKKLILMK